MTEAELRALAANPLFEIGGHTATHPSLPMLDPTEQEQEIVFGSRFLEAKLEKPIRSFSYPFGDWGQVTRDIVMAAGFECAFTAVHRTVRSGDNQFELPRWQVVNRNARTPSKSRQTPIASVAHHRQLHLASVCILASIDQSSSETCRSDCPAAGRADRHSSPGGYS